MLEKFKKIKKYEKDFQNWNLYKTKINGFNKIPYFHEREIWFCSIGINIGHEEDGKNHYFERPVLILKKINRKTFYALPITTKIKKDPYRYTLELYDIDQDVILSQMRVFDAKRLRRFVNKISSYDFQNIKGLFRAIFD